MTKDRWDKWLICGEIVGKVLTPIVIGLAALLFNSQTSQREQAARMAQIAVGILSEKTEYHIGETQPDPLRDWAVSVLQQPGETVQLDEEAAEALRAKGLPQVFSPLRNSLAMATLRDDICIFLKVGEGWSASAAEEECDAYWKEQQKFLQEHLKSLK